MAGNRNTVKGKMALLASATLCAVAVPSSVFAIGLLADDAAVLAATNQFSFTPADADPDMAALIAERSGGNARMMRFTPAGAATSGADRSVTVAVRLDQETAQALAGSSIASPRGETPASGGLSVAPMRYNLGISRGYGSFAQAPARAPALSSALSSADIPDISDFSPRSSSRDEPSRFAARVELDREQPAARASAADGSVGDQLLDVGGSYRLTNNIDITAGVRIEQDRDIVPLPDIDQQDSQAVYVGTQFRF